MKVVYFACQVPLSVLLHCAHTLRVCKGFARSELVARSWLVLRAFVRAGAGVDRSVDGRPAVAR